MKTICAWCNKVLTPGDEEPQHVSHGICPECVEYFFLERQGEQSMERFLNRLDAPVALVDWDVGILAANEKAAAALGKTPEQMAGKRGGDVIECSYARHPEGCGRSVHCEACTIRNTVTRTYRTGESFERVAGFRETVDGGGKKQWVRLAISTEKVRDVVLLRIDELEILSGPPKGADSR
jgi:PAS domain-containing protein